MASDDFFLKRFCVPIIIERVRGISMSLSVVQFSFYAERICFTIRVEYLHNRRGERKKERKKRRG